MEENLFKQLKEKYKPLVNIFFIDNKIAFMVFNDVKISFNSN